MKKKSILTLILICTVMILSACSGMKKEDAQNYVKATLDAGYKAQFKEYIEVTNSTKKAARKEYEDNLDDIMKESGLDEMDISDELKAQYRSLYEKMLKSAKYKVGEAKKGKKGTYVVEVTVYPFTAFSSVSGELNTWVRETYANATEVPSNEELNEAIMQKMYELMNEKVDQPTYDKKKTVQIRVKMNDDKVYYIPAKDLENIDSELFPQT